MPHVETHRFGPGQYESLVLRTWISKVDGDNRRLSARLEGAYTVYCGEGNEHDAPIAEGVDAWSSELHATEDMESTPFLLFEIHHFGDDQEARYTVADRLIYIVADRLMEFALEDWEDPCTDDGEEN